MAEAVALPSAAEAASWVGAEIREIDGAAVGAVEGFFVDSASGEPAWLVARLGRRRSTRLVAVPLRSCAGAAFGVWVALADEAAAQRARGRPGAAAAPRARADDLRALRHRRGEWVARPRSPAAPRARSRPGPPAPEPGGQFLSASHFLSSVSR